MASYWVKVKGLNEIFDIFFFLQFNNTNTSSYGELHKRGDERGGDGAVVWSGPDRCGHEGQRWQQDPEPDGLRHE